MKKELRIKRIAMAAAIMMLTMAMTAMAAPGEVAIGMAPGVDAIITDVPEGKKTAAGFRESIFLTDLGLSAAQQKRLGEHAAAHGEGEEQTMKIYVSTWPRHGRRAISAPAQNIRMTTEHLTMGRCR